jgi:cytochrome c553
MIIVCQGWPRFTDGEFDWLRNAKHRDKSRCCTLKAAPRLSIGLLLLLAALAQAQAPDTEFFEKKIRPVLAGKCYACHNSAAKAPMGGLALDTRAGLHRVVVEGKLLKAIRYTDAQLKMPPTGKLPDTAIADLEQWIAIGAPDPRQDAAPITTRQGIDFEKGKKWWAFQPLKELDPPKVSNPQWPRRKIDYFILAKLDENKLEPSPAADKRTLIRRAYFDLIGLPPSYEDVQAFVANPAPDAYEQLIDKLLASSHYGERWGRYWLDVARWAEDHPTSESTNQPHKFAWRYRDWVIEAFNRDVPYNQFIKLQFAADLLPGFKPDDMRALGYIGNSPMTHKDPRLSKDVIETLASDDWDERVDAVSRGLLGMTVACARCHDHKFDPISTKDYYALAGVFASTWLIKRPIVPMEKSAEEKLVWDSERVVRLGGELGNLGELNTIRPELRPKIPVMKAEIAKLKEELAKSDIPLTHAIVDAGVWIDGSDPTVTWIELKPGVPRDLPVFLHGNVSTPGEIVPRRFLTVLSKGEPQPFRVGSGRLELAEKIVGDAAPLAARVIVNRVWGWHFGRPLSNTPSDFGSQGERPTHPELLDDLAARFVANGWSFKWLHREIMLSAAYAQASAPNDAANQSDPTNRWVWRMNPRRLDVEAWRDAILAASGTLDSTVGGPSVDLESADNVRRSVYAKISRSRLHAMFRLYDFPDASQHSPGREITTTPLQQLFVLNSEFLQGQAASLVGQVPDLPSPEKVRYLYARVLGRDPKAKEVDLGLSFLAKGKQQMGRDVWPEYAQALLSTSEFMFLQ